MPTGLLARLERAHANTWTEVARTSETERFFNSDDFCGPMGLAEARCSEPLPELLYSGTTLTYLVGRVQRDRGMFSHVGGPVWLSSHYLEALGFAHKRSTQYRDAPAVVVAVTRHLARKPSQESAWYVADRLPPGSFYFLRSVRPASPDDPRWNQLMRDLAQVAESSTCEDLERMVAAAVIQIAVHPVWPNPAAASRASASAPQEAVPVLTRSPS